MPDRRHPIIARLIEQLDDACAQHNIPRARRAMQKLMTNDGADPIDNNKIKFALYCYGTLVHGWGEGEGNA